MLVLSLLVAVFSTASIYAAERLEVLICNSANLPEYVVTKAENEAAFVFQSADVEVKWSNCQDIITPHDKTRLFIRLRSDLVPRFGGELSLHAMGRAFVSNDEGDIADVYYPATQAVSRTMQVDLASLIGYTIAHEIGHLLLGPGHRPHGIMRARWDQPELVALSQRSLKFDKPDRVRLRERLRQTSTGRN